MILMELVFWAVVSGFCGLTVYLVLRWVKSYQLRKENERKSREILARIHAKTRART